MSEPARRPQLRLVHIVYAVVIYSALVTAAWPRRTYDVWWHLATGRYIVQEGVIPHADVFTHTREGEPWTAHEWLWELIMYALYARWGFAGLIAMKALLCAGAAAALTWISLRRGAMPLVVMAGGMLGIFAARALFNVRPQLASLVLLIVLLVLVQLAREGRWRWLWLAPVVMLLWVNLHGGFIFGIAFMGLFAMCLIPGWLRPKPDDQPSQPPIGVMAGVLAAMALACLANPNGLSGALYPLEYLTGASSYHKQLISDYASPDFSAGMFSLLGPYVLVMLAAFALSRKRLDLFDLAVSVVFLYLALRWQRNVALFVFATAPIVALQLSDFARARLSPTRDRAASNDGGSQLVYVLVIICLAVSSVFALRSAVGHVDEVFAEDYPVECLQVAQKMHLRGPMFNTYRWGGYLIWNMYPDQRVFIDGRADVMGQELMADWMRCHKLEPGWREVLDRYGIQWVLITRKSPLCRALRMTSDFRLLRATDEAELFIRDPGVNSPASRTTL